MPKKLFAMKYYRAAIVILLLALGSSTRADIAADKRAEIDKMMQLTGMEKLIDQMVTQMFANFKANTPDAPPEVWDAVAAKMNARQLIEKIVPIYDKYYSVDDLRAINAFYSTPAGQKIISTMPQVMQECMTAGQEWGKQAGQAAVDEIAAKKKNSAK